MMVQFAWTLRQEGQIESIQLSIGGQPVPLPGGVAAYPVDSGLEYDPAGFQATPLLYGLSRGRVVAGTAGSVSTVAGPMGQRKYGLSSVGVNLEGITGAGVADDGASVLVGPLAQDGAVRTTATGTDFLRPAWDFFDRMWLVDRTPNGARISYVGAHADAPRNLQVRGITGEQVRVFLVSRDGTRLVAVVRRPSGDALMMSRIEHNSKGRVIGAVDAKRIDVADVADLPIRDIVWRTSSTLAVLSPITSTLAEVAPASVDGAPMIPEVAATTVDGQVPALAGSPVSSEPIYAITPDGLIDINSADRRPIPFELLTTAIVYVG